MPGDSERYAEVRSFRLARTADHLDLNITDLMSRDDRNRSATAPASPAGTRGGNKKNKTERTYKYVARHHYHPQILQQFVVYEGFKNIDYIDAQFLKDAGLIDNGYTEEDRFKGSLEKVEDEVYVPVPSYPTNEAERDYMLASSRARLNAAIKSCCEKFKGESFLASRAEMNDNDLLKPLEELPPFQDDKVPHLQRQVRMLSDDLNAALHRIQELEEENKALKFEVGREDSAVIERYVQEGKQGGLCRLSISSDAYHKSNPNVAKKLFGFADRRKKEDNPLSSWDVTKNFIKCMFGIEHKEPTIKSTRDASGRSKKLSRFEQILLTLTFFTNAFDYEYIATIFGVTRKVVGLCIKGWAPHFREVGYHLARLSLTKDFLDQTYPTAYHDLDFTNPVATVVDGTDVPMDTVRSDRYVSISQSSNKIKNSAARGITWSSPMGLVHEFSDPFFARASEKAIVKLWASEGRLVDLPDNYLVSGDKGFDKTSGFYPKYNPVIHPAFLTGGDGAQFTEEEMGWNRKACKNRYTSEVVFSRVKKYGGLSGIIRRHNFNYVRDLWAFAHGMANMYSCILSPHDSDYFPTSDNVEGD